MLGALLGQLGTRIFGGLSVVLLLGCGALWLRGNHYESEWRGEQQTVAELKAAAVAAEREQKRVNDENQQRQLELARRADNAEDTLDRLRTAADRFADANSVRRVCGGRTRQPGTTPEDRPAPDRDGPGTDAVLLTRPEYDEFVSNTLRLERVRQWGQSLIDEGLAIPPRIEFGAEPITE